MLLRVLAGIGPTFRKVLRAICCAPSGHLFGVIGAELRLALSDLLRVASFVTGRIRLYPVGVIAVILLADLA
jgi:hypothetical protein